jgi:membrane protein DedA with SNARE-associated domain
VRRRCAIGCHLVKGRKAGLLLWGVGLVLLGWAYGAVYQVQHNRLLIERGIPFHGERFYETWQRYLHIITGLSPGFYLVISAGVIFILLAVLLIVMKHRKAASIETDKINT